MLDWQNCTIHGIQLQRLNKRATDRPLWICFKIILEHVNIAILLSMFINDPYCSQAGQFFHHRAHVESNFWSRVLCRGNLVESRLFHVEGPFFSFFPFFFKTLFFNLRKIH